MFLFTVVAGVTSVARQRDIELPHTVRQRDESLAHMEHTIRQDMQDLLAAEGEVIRQGPAENATDRSAAVVSAFGSIGFETQYEEAQREVATIELGATSSASEQATTFAAVVPHQRQRDPLPQGDSETAALPEDRELPGEAAEALARGAAGAAVAQALVEEAELAIGVATAGAAAAGRAAETALDAAAAVAPQHKLELPSTRKLAVGAGGLLAMMVLASLCYRQTIYLNLKGEAPRKPRGKAPPEKVVLPMRVAGARIVVLVAIPTDSLDDRVIAAGTLGVVRDSDDSDLLIDFDGETLSRWVLARDSAKLRAATPTDVLDPARRARPFGPPDAGR